MAQKQQQQQQRRRVLSYRRAALPTLPRGRHWCCRRGYGLLSATRKAGGLFPIKEDDIVRTCLYCTIGYCLTTLAPNPNTYNLTRVRVPSDCGTIPGLAHNSGTGHFDGSCPTGKYGTVSVYKMETTPRFGGFFRSCPTACYSSC